MFPITETILQGSVFGPIKCSIQVDTFGRDLLSDPEGLGIFKYKGLIDIPPLSLIDYVICVSLCGIQSIEYNALLNSKFESMKLRLSHDKSVRLHLSKDKASRELCPQNLKIQKHPMKSSEKTLYLGDILNEDMSYDSTINSRVTKSVGIITQAQSLLSFISHGSYHFEIA